MPESRVRFYEGIEKKTKMMIKSFAILSNWMPLEGIKEEQRSELTVNQINISSSTSQWCS